MANNWKRFKINNPNWPLLFVPLIPLCCLGMYFGLTTGRRDTYNPSWSPTGEMIAFECVYLKAEDFKGGFEPIYDFNMRDICIKDIPNKKSERLTVSRYNYSPSWSSDGRYLAWIYSYEQIVVWDSVYKTFDNFPAGKLLEYDDMAGDHLLWIKNDSKISLQGRGVMLDLDTREYTFLPEEHEGKRVGIYSISPNGINTLLTYNVRDEDDERGPLWRLIIINGTRIITTPVTIIPRHEYPAWNRDGNHVVWVGEKNPEDPDTVFLMITNCLTGKTKQVSIPDIRAIRDLAWSSDGNRIVFVSSYNDELHVLDIKIESASNDISIIGNNIVNIPEKHSNSPLSLSPNGDRVTYSRIPYMLEGKVIVIEIDID